MKKRNLSRRGFLISTAALGSQLFFIRRASAATRPNILYVMTDDQHYKAMSCLGNTVIKTPNMDRIAREGAVFRNAFVTNSLCSPSRACFMTGKYSHTHGVRRNGVPLVGQRVFTDYLREAGYHTCFIGKWHMRGDPPRFDYWLGFSGQGRYTNPKLLDFSGKLVQEKGHVTDKLADRAVEYLKKHRRDPFCLLLWFKSPHRPWIPAPRFEKALEDVEIPEPPAFHDDYSGKPEAVRKTEMQVEIAKKGKTFKEWVKDYYRTILGVDENLGRVLQTLDDLKLTENTIVVYTTDNGFFLGEHHFFDKRLMYEPSIRIPMLMRYPAAVKAGMEINEMVLNVDLAPTLLDLAGVKVPDDMHGRSWKPLLQGKKVAWRKSFLYEYYEFPAVHMVRKNRGVRTERWKYIHYFEEPQEFELYDLQNDPNEMNNLYGDPKYADVVERLRAELLRLRRETGDPDL